MIHDCLNSKSFSGFEASLGECYGASLSLATHQLFLYVSLLFECAIHLTISNPRHPGSVWRAYTTWVFLLITMFLGALQFYVFFE